MLYNQVIQNIAMNGYWDKDQEVRTKWKDGTPAYTKSVISQQIVFDGTEVPILTTKKVAWKTAIKEILWIWQKKSNVVEELRQLNGTGRSVWDEWEKEDGTIGKSYGYQMGKKVRQGDYKDTIKGVDFYEELDQVDYLIRELKKNPASRRHVTSLWNINDLDDMALNPCVWHTQWIVKERKLHLVVGIRSNDWALGAPFNQFQYYVLQRMIAQVTGYEMGTTTFNINDCHYYERHEEGLLEQMKLPQYEAPTLWINPNVTDFYDFTPDDFKLIGYEHGPSIGYEIAI